MKQGPEEKTALLETPWQDEPPVLTPGQSYGSMTDQIADAVLTRPIGLGWLAGLAIGMGLLGILMAAVTYLFLVGVGIWGINIPIGWGFAIINFVWWIGIGHAGTLISAILLLLKQSWRNSINRFAEAMTLFAVACAGMFPLLHMGRPWLGYWMFPYPSSMGVWPQFRSPLVWDVFAVSTYATISAVFWYVGLVPDFATMREKAVSRYTKSIYGMLAMGWRGSARHWKRYEALYILLAGHCHSTGAVSAHCGQLSILRSLSFLAGIPRSFRRILSRAPSTPALPWCWCWQFPSATTTAWKT